MHIWKHHLRRTYLYKTNFNLSRIYIQCRWLKCWNLITHFIIILIKMSVCRGDECVCVCVRVRLCVCASNEGLNLTSHIEHYTIYVYYICMATIPPTHWRCKKWMIQFENRCVKTRSSLFVSTYLLSSVYARSRSRSRIRSGTHIISIIIAHHPPLTHLAHSQYEILYVNTGKLLAFIQLHSGSFYLFIFFFISLCLPATSLSITLSLSVSFTLWRLSFSLSLSLYFFLFVIPFHLFTQHICVAWL